MSRRVKTVFLGLVAATILSCGLCGGCIYQSWREIPKVKAAADAFLDQIGQGRIKEAYGATTPAFRSAATLERFRALVEQYPILTDQGRRSMGGYRVMNGNQAFVQYNLTNPKNSLSMSLTLVKDRGRWQVQGINLP